MATVDFSGLDRLQARLRRIAQPEATMPVLMASWTKIVADDNRRGILAGLDKDGLPMAPVTYRPRPTARPLTAAHKNHPRKGAKRGEFAGFGAHPGGVNNNLTSAEYRRLAGPPLAPRGAFSRVVTNLRFRWGEPVPGLQWELIGYWDEVVNLKGQRFLHYHFDGAAGGGRARRVVLPRRDLRGIRPDGVARARTALRAWAIGVIRDNS
jgi:hypothetical protein